MLNLKELRALPVGALVILILMSGAFVVGASLVWVGLTVPADGTVVDTPVETVYFSSSVNPFHFGSVGLASTSPPISFTVTNNSTISRTLHIYAQDLTAPGVSLVVTYPDGTPYTPIILSPQGTVNLKASLQTTATAQVGPLNLSVKMD